MTRRPHGDTVADLLYILGEYGPMTRAEMGQYLKVDRRNLSSIITRMGKPTIRLPKRIYIERYVHDMEGQKQYPRAVYAVGDQPDAKRPLPDPKAAKRRYNARLKGKHTGNFVFNLALPRRIYENRTSA